MKTLFIKKRAKWHAMDACLAFVYWLLVAGLSAVALSQPAQASTPALTLVSLTFDDGLTQSPVRNILASHGMQGTFYVNSNLINSGGTYLTKAELDGLYADGNEIGGHTINHVDLATLSDAAQQTAICTDMQNLVNWGYPIHSFAYPYGSTGVNTQSIVMAGCPGVGTYESARGVGGLLSGTECTSCPWAESIPASNIYHISSNKSVDTTTTLDDLKTYVTQAETNGGGWVTLLFHRVCDNCVPLSVSPATLDAFLAWLEGRQLQSTYVKTVHQVMSGDYPSPPQLQLSSNLLINASLEDDIDGNNQADCWTRDGYGSNSPSWTRISDAHTGSFAEQLNITSYSTGDRKLVPTMDAGQPNGCAPAVAAGDVYQIGAWYKSTVPSFPVLFYLDASGVWQYWRDGAQLPVSNSWAQMTFNTGAVPTGAQAISFGIALERVGTLTTDDYSLALVQDSQTNADVAPPTIANFSPVNGANVSGVVPLTASATDNVAVQRVEFLINGTVIATDTTSPYAAAWNSLTATNGAVAYSVRAVDLSGNTALSATNQLNVFNDTTPPVVSLTQPPTPVEGGIVSGLVALAATASDDVAVTRVDFLVNGAVVGSANTAPYAINWNSLLNANGGATLAAVAFDAAGNQTQTPIVNVTVSNNVGNLLTNPSLELDANKDGIADCWQRTGYGTNAYSWTRISNEGHTGNFAEQLQVTSLASGDRKLVQRQDTSTCAPSVTVGARYTLSGWYKSTLPVGIVVYYRNSAGTWIYWQTSSNAAAASNWAKASYTTPPVPAGATAISFGLYLNNIGTLVTDDYMMTLAP
ncbi:Ig-like domain-containing protein [Methylovulum psychrotolerans]|uniref:Polysaccharide deacetylase n=1 Tax=Methylovulum psychrotolerans TaxID=1704499 RepID=A0A2S5CGG6_9GAMM|nr:Ig-like domain-containing protein [Methylovulum psychrotolerans]POZ49857.1 polysaccharide deacetylase [Methylovulum psychrotolerans]